MRIHKVLVSLWAISVVSFEWTDAFKTFAPNVFSKRITTKVMMVDSSDPQTISSTPQDTTTVKFAFGSWSEKGILVSANTGAPQAKVSSIFTENRPIEKLDDESVRQDPSNDKVVNESNQSNLGEFSDIAATQYGKAVNDAVQNIQTESESSFDYKEPIHFSIDKDIRQVGSSLSKNALANENKMATIYTEEYAAWCREFNKVPDEHRFQVFSTNYEVMGKYCKENGVEMDLTEFADLTEDEYFKLMTKEEQKHDTIAVTKEEGDVRVVKDLDNSVSKENSAENFTNELDNLEELEALQADNGVLSKEIAELEEKLESFDDESKGTTDEQQVQLSEKETSADLKNQLSKMKEEKDIVIEELKKELADVKKSKSKVETTYTSLISSLKSSKEKLTKKYETMLQSKNDKINSLEEKISERDSIIDRMTNEMKKLRSFIKKLTSGKKDKVDDSDSKKKNKMMTNNQVNELNPKGNSTCALSMANADSSNSNVSKKTLRNRRRRQNKRRRMREKKHKGDDDNEHETDKEMKEKIKNAYVKMSKLHT